MGDNTERTTDKYEWNVVLDCAVYPMVYRMERIEEETAVGTSQQQQQQPLLASATIDEQPEVQRPEEASTEEVSLSCYCYPWLSFCSRGVCVEGEGGRGGILR